MTPSGTRLIRGRSPSEDDGRVAALIEAIPRVQRGSARVLQRLAVANEKGAVYREVDVFSPLELIHLVARMNAIGYGLDPVLRDRHRLHYANVFSIVARAFRVRHDTQP